jgi:hypothetical protein
MYVSGKPCFTISCKVEVRSKIWIRLDYKDNNYKLPKIYGHEQQHVKNAREWVKDSEELQALRDRYQGHIFSESACNIRAPNLACDFAAKFQNMLKKKYASGTDGWAHFKDPPGPPPKQGGDYDPIGIMPPSPSGVSETLP